MSDFPVAGRYSIFNIDFTVIDANGVAVDADGAVTGTLINYQGNATVATRELTPLATTGEYRFVMSSVETSIPGLFHLDLSYTLGGITQVYSISVEVSEESYSAYELLPDAMKAIVDQVWLRFSDGFDSTLGGPNLQEYAQSSFGRDKLAKLIPIALGTLNASAMPFVSFPLDGEGFPFEPWGPLLSNSLYIEGIKHLIRSYIEQPTPQGVTTSRLDRSTYYQRWTDILDSETGKGSAFNTALASFRISFMGLGRAAVLVSGGVYAGMAQREPARPRFTGGGPPLSGRVSSPAGPPAVIDGGDSDNSDDTVLDGGAG